MNDRIYYSREAELRANRDKALLTLLFLAMGLGIGAALALLFAPRSGEQTRVELAKTVDTSLDEGRERIQFLEKELADLRKKIESRLGDLR